jgi:hypothetical protein
LDKDADGVRVEEEIWSNCTAPVQLARIVGGGHTYPNGRQYLDVSEIGPTLREWGAERIWAWFAAAAGLQKSHLTGQWWTPGQGGWGLSIAQQGSVLVPIWYTYDLAGRPTWLLGSGLSLQTDGSYTGPLFRSTGTPFALMNQTASLLTTTQVGTLQLKPDGSELIMSYQLDGRSGTHRLQQLLPAPNPTCLPVLGSRAQARNATDVWWNPLESGWGLQMSEFGDQLFVTWYTYGNNGEPMWLVAQLPRVQGNRFEGELLRPNSGTPYTNINGPATSFPVPTVGSLRVEFNSGDSAQFRYTLDGITRERTIRRFEFSGPTRSECN